MPEIRRRPLSSWTRAQRLVFPSLSGIILKITSISISKETVKCKCCLLCFIKVLSLIASTVCKSNNLFEGDSADVAGEGWSIVLANWLSCVMLGDLEDLTFCFSWSSRFALMACLIACDLAKRLVVGSFAAAGLWIAMKRKELSEKPSATRRQSVSRSGWLTCLVFHVGFPMGRINRVHGAGLLGGRNWLLLSQSRRNWDLAQRNTDLRDLDIVTCRRTSTLEGVQDSIAEDVSWPMQIVHTLLDLPWTEFLI